MNPIRFLCFLLLLTSLAWAEKYALLVGINDYQGDISPLRYCVTDVEAFRDALVDVADYKPENVHLMTDQMEGRDLPQFNNVLLRLETLARQGQPEDKSEGPSEVSLGGGAAPDIRERARQAQTSFHLLCLASPCRSIIRGGSPSNTVGRWAAD